MVAKILVVEDDKRMADLIRRELADNDYDVTPAYDGQEGLKLAQAGNFDLILTDVMLPKLSGLDLCKILKNEDESIPIIMLTALGTTDNKVGGFDAGADDYMVKPFELRELLARIRAQLKHSGLIKKSEKLQIADLELNLLTKTAKRNNIEIKLSPREFNLLSYMMQHPDRVLSKQEISEKVWDTHFDTGTNFIDVYISYLRRKVDKNFELKLIHTRPGMGFILTDKDD
jgi:DNA-binding response OmpR family regulator